MDSIFINYELTMTESIEIQTLLSLLIHYLEDEFKTITNDGIREGIGITIDQCKYYFNLFDSDIS